MRLPGPLKSARFLERPNRFLTVVELDGERVEAHLPDPGRLKELLTPGTKVWVRPAAGAAGAAGAARKTRFTLALAEAPTGELVSLVTTVANELTAEALEAGRIAELAEWSVTAREFRRGRSRFDFLLETDSGRQMLLEVKSVTLVENCRALFPDAVTARGTRHVRELTEALEDGFDTAVLFVVQRRDSKSISAARSIDPRFADALEAAHRAGVMLLGYRSRVTLSEALLTESIPVLISN